MNVFMTNTLQEACRNFVATESTERNRDAQLPITRVARRTEYRAANSHRRVQSLPLARPVFAGILREHFFLCGRRRLRRTWHGSCSYDSRKTVAMF
jgi:hypothetical protein